MNRWVRVVTFGIAGMLMVPAQLLAASSTNYRINEDNIGIGSTLNSASTSYKELGIDDGGSTLGDTAVGNSSSANYQTGSGFNTTNTPRLVMIVNAGTVDLGTLSTGSKKTATATFSVLDYTSTGYRVTVIGNPPTNAGHQLAPLTTDTASVAGTEQFGINVVRNTTAAVGADPVQAPTGPPTFGFGVAGDGSTGTYGTTRPYTISDKWRYNSGETIASSPQATGETDYTITFMANMSNLSPGGKYSSNIVLVATGTF